MDGNLVVPPAVLGDLGKWCLVSVGVLMSQPCCCQVLSPEVRV